MFFFFVKNVALSQYSLANSNSKMPHIENTKKNLLHQYLIFCRKKSSDKEAENIGEKSVELIKIFEGLRAQYMQNKS